ncbi:hypothetical protein ABET51_15440 [Metabacillus fastidiosus]|uniref:hypothetical protein n=1 Tax=Metabacillus fastidiosus TaxID=1458 RepID=UPI003D287C41
MSSFIFVIIFILIGILLINRYNKLPHPIVTFLSVFFVMYLIYTIPFLFTVIARIF